MNMAELADVKLARQVHAALVSINATAPKCPLCRGKRWMEFDQDLGYLPGKIRHRKHCLLDENFGGGSADTSDELTTANRRAEDAEKRAVAAEAEAESLNASYDESKVAQELAEETKRREQAEERRDNAVSAIQQAHKVMDFFVSRENEAGAHYGLPQRVEALGKQLTAAQARVETLAGQLKSARNDAKNWREQAETNEKRAKELAEQIDEAHAMMDNFVSRESGTDLYNLPQRVEVMAAGFTEWRDRAIAAEKRAYQQLIDVRTALELGENATWIIALPELQRLKARLGNAEKAMISHSERADRNYESYENAAKRAAQAEERCKQYALTIQATHDALRTEVGDNLAGKAKERMERLDGLRVRSEEIRQALAAMCCNSVEHAMLRLSKLNRVQKAAKSYCEGYSDAKVIELRAAVVAAEEGEEAHE